MAKTQWLTNAEGKIHFPVLKPFTFNVPVTTRRSDGVDTIFPNARHFGAGVHLLDPGNDVDAAVLAHPWIDQHFADGSVENPVKTKERIEQEAAAAEAEAARRTALLADAQAALDRSTTASESSDMTSKEVQDELNTPLNQPRNRGKKS